MGSAALYHNPFALTMSTICQPRVDYDKFCCMKLNDEKTLSIKNIADIP